MIYTEKLKDNFRKLNDVKPNLSMTKKRAF